MARSKKRVTRVVEEVDLVEFLAAQMWLERDMVRHAPCRQSLTFLGQKAPPLRAGDEWPA